MVKVVVVLEVEKMMLMVIRGDCEGKVRGESGREVVEVVMVVMD